MQSPTTFLTILGIATLIFTLIFAKTFLTPAQTPDVPQPAVIGHDSSGKVELTVSGNAGQIMAEVVESG